MDRFIVPREPHVMVIGADAMTTLPADKPQSSAEIAAPLVAALGVGTLATVLFWRAKMPVPAVIAGGATLFYLSNQAKHVA